MKHIRTITIIALTSLALLLCILVYQKLGTAHLTLVVSPSNATVQINGKSYTTKEAQDIALPYGNHNLVIAAPGHKPLAASIELGWRESVERTYVLNLAPFADIIKITNPDIDQSLVEVVQGKFFENNTWAAGYIVPKDEEEGDISVIVVQNTGGEWRLVLHNDAVPADAAQKLPASVYEYIKPFGQE